MRTICSINFAAWGHQSDMMRASTFVLVVAVWLPACISDATDPLDESQVVPFERRVPGGEVTVQVYGRTGSGIRSLSGFPVLFHTPSGALLSRSTTDASGRARGFAVRGGAVTIVERGSRILTTIFDVAPGDALTVGDVGSWGPALLGTATVEVPLSPNSPDDEYDIQGPCTQGNSGDDSSDPPTSVPVQLWPACPATRPTVAISYQSNFQAMTGYLYDPAASFIPGRTTMLNGAWLPPGTFDLALTGVPGDVGLRVHRFLVGQLIFQFMTSTFLVRDGSFAEQFRRDAIVGDGTMTTILFGWGGGAGGFNSIQEYHAGQTVALTADVSADLIARPVDEVAAIGQLSPHGPNVPVGGSWRLVGNNTADGMIAQLRARDHNLNAESTWTAVLPPGTLQYRLPRLPEDLVDLWTGVPSLLRVVNVDSPATSYDEFRPSAEPDHVLRSSWARPTPGKVRLGCGTYAGCL